MNINRRDFLKATSGLSAGIISGALPALLTSCSKNHKLDTKDMNILFISVEDWSSFALGCYGNNIVRTPHVDALASKGVKFTRAYCQSPVCNPSRASLITGRRPDSTMVYGNGHHLDEYVPEGVPDMGSFLKQRGAYTVSAGKLVHKWQHARRFVNGFDHIIYDIDYDHPGKDFKGKVEKCYLPPDALEKIDWEWLHFPDKKLAERLEKLRQERDTKIASGIPDTWAVRKPFQQLFAEQVGDSGLKEEYMQDGRLARHVSGLLSQMAKEKRQFFISFGFYGAHTPLLAPKKYVDMYNPDDMQLTPAPREKDKNIPNVVRRFGNNYDIFNGMYPEYQPKPQRQKQAIAAYYACASYVDAQVGILLDTLEKEGLSQNTIVIFFSDHGFHLGEHGCWSKFTLFEQSTRVPLIAYVQGGKANGSTCDEIVELVDVLPTLCDLWEIKKPESFEGISFTPLLENPNQPWKEAAFSMITLGGLGRSVRTKRFKYAEYRKTKSLPSEGEEPFAKELYDLENDPYEQNNLVDDAAYSDEMKKLAELLKEGWKSAVPGS